MNVLLVHGWAGHCGIWSRLTERLGALVEDRPLEFHFGGFAAGDLPAGNFDLAIGHSAGVVTLLQSQRLRSQGPQLIPGGLVSIAGFTRFAASDGFPGVDGRVLNRMQRRFAQSPRETVEDFWNNASSETAKLDRPPQQHPDRGEALAAGLCDLQTADCREQWKSFCGPRLVIAATEDRIVPTDLTTACFDGERIEWVKTDSHWLPWNFPETCAALIRELIEQNWPTERGANG